MIFGMVWGFSPGANTGRVNLKTLWILIATLPVSALTATWGLLGVGILPRHQRPCVVNSTATVGRVRPAVSVFVRCSGGEVRATLKSESKVS